ncbi:MAG TPA: DUF885 family protein [Caulobacteraceae bacterium]|jgi:uncharacterized protein (DUF885 family)|nr:DUF885 family protein [Caulobacteraceae bacterium]
MLDRRQLLASAAAAAALSPLSIRAQGRAQAAAPSAEDARLLALFDGQMARNLHRRPESATQLGLDKGPDAALRWKLSDNSEAGRQADRAANAGQLHDLEAIDRAALSPSRRVDLDSVLYTRRSAARIYDFPFGGSGYGASPYVVSQQTGAYQSLPVFLDTKHPIAADDDCKAYLARMEAYAGQLDNDTGRMAHDAALGVVPPDFILDTTLAQLTATRTSAADNLLVRSIARRAAAKGLSASYAQDAAKLYDARIAPAYDRQIAALRRLREHARHDAGVGQFKDGAAFYAAALKSATTTPFSPDEVHRIGLDQGAQIGARIDALLKAQGMSQGTVGERLVALTNDPRQNFPDDDAGKAAAIAFCNQRLDAIRPRLPTRFKRLPPYQFEVRRVPLNLEPGAAAAYSEGAAIDGSRPGIVYINLHHTSDWPRWTLSSVIFHEGLPGHQLEGGLALSNKSLPLIRKTMGFSGYAEGWALYAEQLADEMGMYEADPLSRVGYLQGQLFRAGRCVVDTGIHHLGWSREKAIGYFVDTVGYTPARSALEVDRYCVNPGQACSYKLGHTIWVGARARAEKALGPRYDIKDFHEAGLGCGRVPLEVLDRVIDDWIARSTAV